MSTTQGSLVDGVPTKLCPFCAEPVRVEAIKCKHCGSALPTQVAPGQAPPPVAVRLTKRVGGFWGYALAVLAFFQIPATCSLLMQNQVGPAIVAAALGAGFFWWAKNAGGVWFPCPGCKARLDDVLSNKTRTRTCAMCGHKIEMRPRAANQ